MAGIRILHVPYREIAAARSDVIAGRVALQSSNVPGSLPLLQSGQMRCLAHCGPPGALPLLPGVPAMAETLPGFEAWEWNGVFAPGGTPAGILERLNAEMNATLAEPAVAQRLAGLGALTRANTVAEFAAFRAEQIAFFADMVRRADIRIEQR
jgi:tripartite-type tricarboxylate transporter receptor subunit TctC